MKPSCSLAMIPQLINQSSFSIASPSTTSHSLALSLNLIPSWRPIPEPSRPLRNSLLANAHDIDRNRIELNGVCQSSPTPQVRPQPECDVATHPKALQQIFRITIYIQLPALALREVQSRNLRDVLILAFALLFLQLEGYTADGSSLDTSHEVGCVACDLLPNGVRR